MNKKSFILIIIVIFLITNLYKNKNCDRYSEENIKKFIEKKKNYFKKKGSIKKYRNALSIVKKSEMMTKKGIKYKEYLIVPFIKYDLNKKRKTLSDFISDKLRISNMGGYSNTFEIGGKKARFGCILIFGKHVSYGFMSGWFANGLSKPKIYNILKKKESLIKTIKQNINYEVDFQKFKVPVCEKSNGCGGVFVPNHQEDKFFQKIFNDLEKKILKDKQNFEKTIKFLRKKIFSKKELFKNENQSIFYELNK
jgi:hypothetical protein